MDYLKIHKIPISRLSMEKEGTPQLQFDPTKPIMAEAPLLFLNILLIIYIINSTLSKISNKFFYLIATYFEYYLTKQFNVYEKKSYYYVALGGLLGAQLLELI